LDIKSPPFPKGRENKNEKDKSYGKKNVTVHRAFVVIL